MMKSQNQNISELSAFKIRAKTKNTKDFPKKKKKTKKAIFEEERERLR